MLENIIDWLQSNGKKKCKGTKFECRVKTCDGRVAAIQLEHYDTDVYSLVVGYKKKIRGKLRWCPGIEYFFIDNLIDSIQQIHHSVEPTKVINLQYATEVVKSVWHAHFAELADTDYACVKS